MTPETLLSWQQQSELLNRDTLEELRAVLARHPYFQAARLLYLKNLYVLRDASFADELRRSVLFVADRRMLFRLIEGCMYDRRAAGKAVSPVAAGKEEPSVDRTLALIVAFLADMPEEQPKQMELDYTMDYMAYLMQEDADADGGGSEAEEAPDVPKLRGQELIDGFIRGDRLARPDDGSRQSPDGAPVASDAELDDSYFTETLAKIYIRQHRYEKALEIIKKLSLKYPKKSAYFADQIRDVEQMIINAKSK